MWIDYAQYGRVVSRLQTRGELRSDPGLVSRCSGLNMSKYHAPNTTSLLCIFHRVSYGAWSGEDSPDASGFGGRDLLRSCLSSAMRDLTLTLPAALLMSNLLEESDVTSFQNFDGRRLSIA